MSIVITKRKPINFEIYPIKVQGCQYGRQGTIFYYLKLMFKTYLRQLRNFFFRNYSRVLYNKSIFDRLGCTFISTSDVSESGIISIYAGMIWWM